MKIFFNGSEFKAKEGTSLQTFLEENDLPISKIAIEINLEVIPKSQYSSFLLKDGMKIEAITFVGGG
jgi:thiamine biosynthesis protein ThiS